MTQFPTGRWLSALAPWLGVLALNCSADPGSPPPGGGPSSAGSSNVAGASSSNFAGAASSAGGGVSVNPLGRAKCNAPPGATGSPRTIEEAITLLNALPKPTNVACFVESLDRPFTAYATNSVFSAQPALSTRSPRVFIKLNNLRISIVIDGDSSYLLEFSYLLDDLHTIKGEVKTPIDQALAPSAPYDRVHSGEGTTCGVCHYGEEQVLDITFAAAFASIPFRPRPETYVSLDGLAAEARACDWVAEPHRCELLSALFDNGSVTEEAFPPAMPTFY
ncbi:MAG: hypothetical protein ABI548_13645 [Polyangiaceae bacterium]